MKPVVYVGFDPREADAFGVCVHSLKRYRTQPIPIKGLVLHDLQLRDLYTRPIEWRPNHEGRMSMWDPISGAPMSTEHANARFLVPTIAGPDSWAMFVDGDFLFRDSVARLFGELDARKAVYCVKHPDFDVSGVKMDGQKQTRYARKLWSSLMIFNTNHPANKALHPEMINALPGRDLHRLCWLTDEDLIGELDPTWNHLVGMYEPRQDAKAVHFTKGTPSMAGYEDCEYGDEWRATLRDWAAKGG